MVLRSGTSRSARLFFRPDWVLDMILALAFAVGSTVRASDTLGLVGGTNILRCAGAISWAMVFFWRGLGVPYHGRRSSGNLAAWIEVVTNLNPEYSNRRRAGEPGEIHNSIASRRSVINISRWRSPHLSVLSSPDYPSSTPGSSSSNLAFPVLASISNPCERIYEFPYVCVWMCM